MKVKYKSKKILIADNILKNKIKYFQNKICLNFLKKLNKISRNGIKK